VISTKAGHDWAKTASDDAADLPREAAALDARREAPLREASPPERITGRMRPFEVF
jgi:hypothetical protein